MCKNEYVTPELEIALFTVADVLWESGDEVNTDEDMDWIHGFKLG